MSRPRSLAFLAALAALMLVLGACVSSGSRDEVSTDRDDEDAEVDDDKSDRSDDDSDDDASEGDADDDSDDDTGTDSDDDDSDDDSSGDDAGGSSDPDDFDWDGDCSEVDGPCEYGDDAELDRLWDECADSGAQPCDDLFFESPFDSEYEEFGNTCGDRGFEFRCVDEYG